MKQKVQYRPALFALVFILIGCDNTIEPIVDDVTGYAVYGYLDMRTERQVIRVEALRPILLASSGDLGDLSVTSYDNNTGQHFEWTDSSAFDNSGVPITLFTAHFRPLEGHEYSLIVEGSGGTALEATTTIPTAPIFYSDELRGTIENLTQPVFLQGIAVPPQDLRVEYTMINVGEEDPVTIPVSYGNQGFALNEGWTFNVNYYSDQYVVMRQLGRDLGEPGIRFKKLALSFAVPSIEWQEAPGSNILNGHGFFGSVAGYQYEWRLDAAGVELLGWIDEQPLE
ncbi:MAG: hypothetical protein O3A57_06715 [Bacteroidetes bacterium]|nr:hypothetical protein [Bacteroidota bacterium]